MQAIADDRIDGARLARGTVLAVDGGRAVVRLDGDALDAARGELLCDVLHTSAQPVRLAVGDVVLLWGGGGNGAPVVLGRVGPSPAPASAARPDSEIPDELVIEARQNLTLRCGDGSVTIRADGKILIKGKDLVSHAQRTNRIRGGSVAIN